MTRKTFLRALLVPLLAGSAWRGRRASAMPTDEVAQRLSLLVQEYDRQGSHRTATRPDTVAAQWLSTQMQGWRVDARLEPVGINRVDPVAAHVQFRERRVDGTPLYDATFTDAGGVTGRIGLPDSGADLLVIDSDAPAWPLVRRESRHAGIVLVTRGPRSGLLVQDAPSFPAPFGPPVLQVSSDERDWLIEQARNGPDVRLVAQVRRSSVEAFNLVARVRGRDPSMPALVVSAPRTAWFRGTSERGGALAVLLETVRAVSAARPARDCLFLSATGSELGGIGLTAFLAAHPELAAAHAWLCLGPGLGAAASRTTLSAAARHQDTVRAVAASAGFEVLQPTGPPSGEPASLTSAGAAWAALRGVDNAYAGMAADRWPDAIDVEALTRATEAAVQLALALGR